MVTMIAENSMQCIMVVGRNLIYLENVGSLFSKKKEMREVMWMIIKASHPDAYF